MRFAACGLLLALVASCGPVPYERLGVARADFVWAERGGRSAEAARAAAKKSPPQSDGSLDWVLNYYQTIGTKVGTYTPTRVRAWIHGAMLVSDDRVNPLLNRKVSLKITDWPHNPTDEELASNHADFGRQDLVFSPPQGLPVGHTYRTLTLSLSFSRWDIDTMLYVFTPLLHVVHQQYSRSPEVVVSLPGYEEVLSALPSFDPEDEAWEHPEVVYTDLSTNGELHLNGDCLYPGEFGVIPPWTGDQDLVWTDPVQSPATPRLSRLAFTGDAIRFWRDPQWQGDRSQMGGPPDIDNEDADGYTMLPFTPITVTNETQHVRFRVHFDLTDLVEVYDHGTPGDKTDDIVVFAPRYWERLSITTEME